MAANSDRPLEVDVHTVRSLLDSQEDLLLLDCREPHEHEFVCLEGSKLVPMKDVPGRLDELEPFRDKRVVVYCHHGGRSLMVTQWLRGQGFAGAQNMSGGIDAWSLKIDPQLPRYA